MNKDIVIALFIIAFVGLFFLKQYDPLKSGKNDPKNALRKVKERYGDQIADWVERIYRLETANFTSGQYKATFSAGMEPVPGINKYPYGWTTPHQNLWVGFPEYKPVGLLKFKENQTGILKPYIAFPNLEAAMFTLATYLEKYENPGRWFSTNPFAQKEYVEKLAKIKPTIVSQFPSLT